MAERMVHHATKKHKPPSEEDLDLLDDILETADTSVSSGKKRSADSSKSKSAGGSSANTNGNNTQTGTSTAGRLAGYKASNKKSSNSKTIVETVAQVESVPSSQPTNQPNSNHEAVMAMLKSIQDAQAKQGNEINSLSQRLQEVENYEEEYFDENEELDDNEGNDIEFEPPAKRQKPSNDENNNRFSSMTKRCKVQDICDSKIDETLASNVTDLFRNGMNDEQYAELTKNENNARPENCEGLTVVRTNQLIWNVISPGAQTDDKKMQFIEKSVIKAATILTKTVNKMAEAEAQVPGLGEYIDSCNDTLALLGHANRQINLARRDFLKPELMAEYLHLCSQSVPYTSWLFGDDVSKTAKDIEDCSKVGNKLRFGRGRGGGYRGGRCGRRGRGGYRGTRGTRGARGFQTSASGFRNMPKPKNSQRGGNQPQMQK